MKRRWDLFYFSAGVLMAAAAFVLWQGYITNAQGVSYSETYSVAEWRNLKNDHGGSVREYSLGPSRWTVVGSAGDVSYSEVWQATDWKDRVVKPLTTDWSGQPYNVHMELVNSSNFGSAEQFLGPGMRGSTTTYTLFPSGFYGVTLGSNFSYYYSIGGISSFPAKWEVTGTINTP